MARNGLGSAGKEPGAVVRNVGCLSVHRPRGAHHAAPVGRADRLVAEADAEDRNGGPESADRPSTEIPASAGVQGPGEMMMWLGARAAISSSVTASFRRTSGFAAQFPDVPREIPDERVVVVEEEDHDAPPKARRMPAALSSVSWYSCAGSESATIPPPAWK